MGTTALWACVGVVLIAGAFDTFTRKIPNVVSLGGLALGLILHAATGAVDGGVLGALHGFGSAFGGALACGIIPFLSWKKGEMGGGDVKLFLAIGSLVGLSMGFNVEALTFVLSLFVLYPYRLVRHGQVKRDLTNVTIAVKNVLRRGGEKIAYVARPERLPPVILAPTIGCALLLTIFQQGILQ